MPGPPVTVIDTSAYACLDETETTTRRQVQRHNVAFHLGKYIELPGIRRRLTPNRSW
jgi:hypothetical protein